MLFIILFFLGSLFTAITNLIMIACGYCLALENYKLALILFFADFPFYVLGSTFFKLAWEERKQRI